MTRLNYEVAPLYQRRDLVRQATTLFERTWPTYYGSNGPGNARHDLSERCRATGLPMAMIACCDDGQVAGSGTLAGPSYGAAVGEEPWIIGLCVAGHMRGQGIASALVSALIDYANNEGHQSVFATTISAQGLLARAGFQAIRELDDGKGVWTILRKDLG